MSPKKNLKDWGVFMCLKYASNCRLGQSVLKHYQQDCIYTSIYRVLIWNTLHINAIAAFAPYVTD